MVARLKTERAAARARASTGPPRAIAIPDLADKDSRGRVFTVIPRVTQGVALLRPCCSVLPLAPEWQKDLVRSLSDAR
jgi:hypothetical protein